MLASGSKPGATLPGVRAEASGGRASADIGLATDGTGIDVCRCISRRLMRLTYDVRLVTPRVIPASSASHVQMVFMLCPTARAASMSGQSARIWPDLVAGFSARRRARRVRACIAQSAEFMSSSFPGTDPLSTKRLPKTIGDGQQSPARCAAEKPLSRTMGIRKAESGRNRARIFDLRQIATDHDRTRHSLALFGNCGRSRRFATVGMQRRPASGRHTPVVEHKGSGMRAVGLPVSALPFQRLTAGCISRPMHPVWDAPSFFENFRPTASRHALQESLSI